jgi:hypothetical protein
LTWFVILPLAVASLLTGLLSALGSTWGLWRHYWVLFKLAINLLATVILLLYTQTVDHFADLARGPSVDLGGSRPVTFVLHSGAALAAVLTATVLAVYKPRGMTPYGQRRQDEQRRRQRQRDTVHTR